MLNNDKIRLMTKLSLFETKNESKALKAGKYYKSDFISLGMLNSAIVATLAFFIVVALVVFMNIEEILEVITTLDFLEIGKVLVSSYLIYLVAYMMIVYVVYRIKYDSMIKEIKDYDATLKELYMIYKKEGSNVHEATNVKVVKEELEYVEDNEDSEDNVSDDYDDEDDKDDKDASLYLDDLDKSDEIEISVLEEE